VAAIAAERAAKSRQRAEQERCEADFAEAARRKHAQRKLLVWFSVILFAVTLAGLGGVLVQWQKASVLSANLTKTNMTLAKTND